MTHTKTIQELAKEMGKNFLCKIRTNGDTYMVLKKKIGWQKDIIKACHDIDDVIPNDYVYQFISDAVDIIAEVDGDDIDTIKDNLHEPLDSSVDIYNADLLKWVITNPSFSCWVDQAIEEMGCTEHFKSLMVGQYLQREAIAFKIVDMLNEMVA